MKKPFVKLREFCPPSLAKKTPAAFLPAESLPLDYLNEVSCFETVRVYDGRIFSLSVHLGRLADSCKAIGKNFPLSLEELRIFIHEALAESCLRDAVLRISVHWKTPEAGHVAIIAREFKAHPKELYEKGVALQTTVSRRWTLRAQDPQIKSSQFIGGVLAHLDISGTASDAHELIFLNEAGLVAEGSVSNLFIVKEKRLLTPSVASGILKGVTRSIVMDIAREEGIKTFETPLTRHEVYAADECFMTNTSSEVLPVVQVDGRQVGDGKPGPITQKLSQAFAEKKSKFLE